MQKITDSEIGKCLRYAYDVTDYTQSYYTQRAPTSTHQQLVDRHFMAKVCELYVYYFFSNLNYNVTYPNFNVAKNKDDAIKNFKRDRDMCVINAEGKAHLIHIKSCRADSKFGMAWLIQSNDDAVTKPGDNEYFALCVYHNPMRVDVVEIAHAPHINWQPVGQHMPSKLVCRYDDLYMS